MSTRSSIFYSGQDGHIYAETSEPVEKWGKFRGYNIYALLTLSSIKKFDLTPDHLIIEFKPGTDAANEMLPVMKFNLNGINEVGVEDDEFVLVMAGDSLYNRILESKKFHCFAPDYKFTFEDFKDY